MGAGTVVPPRSHVILLYLSCSRGSGLVLVCPSLPLATAVFFRVEGGVEVMGLRCLVLWCPLPSSEYRCLLLCRRSSRGHGPTGSGPGVPPPSFFMLLYFLVLTGGGRVWFSGACNGCAPSLSLDTTAVFSFGSLYTCSYYYCTTTQFVSAPRVSRCN